MIKLLIKKYKTPMVLTALLLLLAVVLIVVFQPVKEEKVKEEIPLEEPTPLTPPETPLELQYQQLSAEYLAIQIKYNSAIKAQSDLRNQIALIQLNNQQAQSSLIIQLEDKDEKYNQLIIELASTQQEAQRIKEELSAYTTQLEENYELLKDQLSLFPPKNFSSIQQFKDWRGPLECVGDNTTASWPYDCLKLQAQALKDGFIINFSYAGSRLMHYPTILIKDKVYIISPTSNTTLIDQGTLP